jgi:diketogulonate reductase-like aldo/keto reductase
MRKTAIPGGEKLPLLGQGTWRMGEKPDRRRGEIAALRCGIEMGMTLIDTAEMYADGGAERVVGDAIEDQRDDVFVVTKFYPQNATREKMRAACERSLRRLRTDRIDLYLLHWRGDVPLRETIDGFRALIDEGKIRYAGVSNFDVSDMDELARLKDGMDTIATNEVLCNLERRGIEFDLLPWMRKRHRPVIAYSPIEEGLLTGRGHAVLTEVADRHGATVAQVALAWVIRDGDVIAIPKSSKVAHVKENAGAMDVRLTARDLEDLDGSFAPPDERTPLATR